VRAITLSRYRALSRFVHLKQNRSELVARKFAQACSHKCLVASACELVPASESETASLFSAMRRAALRVFRNSSVYFAHITKILSSLHWRFHFLNLLYLFSSLPLIEMKNRRTASHFSSWMWETSYFLRESCKEAGTKDLWKGFWRILEKRRENRGERNLTTSEQVKGREWASSNDYDFLSSLGVLRSQPEAEFCWHLCFSLPLSLSFSFCG